MAAFADALDLRTGVVDYLGNARFVDVYPRLIQFAENVLNRTIRHRRMITNAALDFDDGAADLPTDYLEMINVYNPLSQPMTGTTIATEKRCQSPFEFYAINGSSVLIGGITDERQCTYYAKLPSIAGALSATNWLLQEFPETYLYAVTIQAALHQKDTEIATAAGSLLAAAIDVVHSDSDSGEYGDAVIRVAGPTP